MSEIKLAFPMYSPIRSADGMVDVLVEQISAVANFYSFTLALCCRFEASRIDVVDLLYILYPSGSTHSHR